MNQVFDFLKKFYFQRVHRKRNKKPFFYPWPPFPLEFLHVEPRKMTQMNETDVEEEHMDSGGKEGGTEPGDWYWLTDTAVHEIDE